MSGKRFFIGLHDKKIENEFVWLDDESPLNKSAFDNNNPWDTNFGQNQPDDSNGEDCAEVRISGKWSDIDCNAEYKYIDHYFVCTTNIFQSSRIFIYGGEGPSEPKAEIVDLLNPNRTCQFENDNLDQYAAKSASVGGYVYGTPLICGGSDNVGGNTSSNKCLSPWDDISLLQFRQSASSVVMYNETVDIYGDIFISEELWITGGRNVDKEEDLSSTEIVSPFEGTSRRGIELPVTVNSHCMVKYNSTHVFLIGGYQNGGTSKKTWIFNPTKNYEYVEGPELNEERYWHSCGKFFSKDEGKEFIIVAGGVNGNGPIDSVELFGTDHSTDGFYAPMQIKLPYPIWQSSMVTAPDGSGVYLIGGFGHNENYGNILEFKQSEHEPEEFIWEVSKTKLKDARGNHMAFHVPKEDTDCLVPDDN